MAANTSYNSEVAARTRAAQAILGDKELLALYVQAGGLPEDLQAIFDHGQKAESQNHAQGRAASDGTGATLQVVAALRQLRKEHRQVLAVVGAALHDLKQAGANSEVLGFLSAILRNEAQVKLKPVADPTAHGGKKRRAVRSLSQEALRAEVARDAANLLALKEAWPALKRRGVDSKRLLRLGRDAEELGRKLADRLTKKAEAKSATQEERAAVRAQRQQWGACYRILSAVGRQDPRIGDLLKEAVRKR